MPGISIRRCRCGAGRNGYPPVGNIEGLVGALQIALRTDGGEAWFGARQRGRRSCAVTLVGSTSFHSAKPLGCYGEGGALFTDDDALDEQLPAQGIPATVYYPSCLHEQLVLEAGTGFPLELTGGGHSFWNGASPGLLGDGRFSLESKVSLS